MVPSVQGDTDHLKEGTFPGWQALCMHLSHINQYTWLQLAPADSHALSTWATESQCESARKFHVFHRLGGLVWGLGVLQGLGGLVNKIFLLILKKNFFSIKVGI